MRVWKMIGLAGLVGATVAGVAVGTKSAQRQRREYREADVDELRDRLRDRFSSLEAETPSPPPD